MFNDIFCDRDDNKDKHLENANFVKTFAGRFGVGQWSFIGPSSEKKRYPSENSPQGAWDHVAEKMWNSPKADIPSSVQQLHCPRVSWKAKDEGSCLYISPLIRIQLIQFIALFFLSISSVSTEQWQLYVQNLNTNQDRTGELVILVGQSIVLGEVKAEALLHDEDPMNNQIIWKQYIQQIESLSPENRVSKFCEDQRLVVNTLCLETIQFHNLKDGFKQTCSDIHGREFPGQSKFHFEHNSRQ